MSRFAVYYAPEPGTALHDFGARWLGRDSSTGRLLRQPAIPHLDLAEITRAPRQYGFHATLKAPFRLVQGRTPAELEAAADGFAAVSTAIPSVRLVVRRIGDWLALVPDADMPILGDFAFAVVRAFDHFRAPLSPEERARRRPETLTERQRDRLERWGYPYVADAFEFHMTLAGPAEKAVLDRLQPILETAWTASAIGPVDIDAIAIFEQSGPGEPFAMRSRHGLTEVPRRTVQDAV